MKKRFIILVDNATKLEDERFWQFISNKGFDWWHYINNSWLLSTPSNYTSKLIAEKMHEIYPGKKMIIFELKKDAIETWSGYGPVNDKRNMFDWVKSKFIGGSRHRRSRQDFLDKRNNEIL